MVGLIFPKHVDEWCSINSVKSCWSVVAKWLRTWQFSLDDWYSDAGSLLEFANLMISPRFHVTLTFSFIWWLLNPKILISASLIFLSAIVKYHMRTKELHFDDMLKTEAIYWWTLFSLSRHAGPINSPWDLMWYSHIEDIPCSIIRRKNSCVDNQKYGVRWVGIQLGSECCYLLPLNEESIFSSLVLIII
jgi:hypothetical protein